MGTQAVMHTKNVAGGARGANWEFQKCKGGEVYTMYILTFQN